MICTECKKELEIGDKYIKCLPHEVANMEINPEIDNLILDLFGGHEGHLIYCEDCTILGGQFLFDTIYGDEDEADED